MKLITKQIEKAFAKHPLYSQDGKGYEATAIAKFFLPCGAWTWYITEAEKQGDDWLFFGLVINGHGEKELGYFTLSQLEEIRVWGCIKVERDRRFEATPLSKCA